MKNGKWGKREKREMRNPPPPDVLMGSVRNRVTKVTIRITGIRWAIHYHFFPRGVLVRIQLVTRPFWSYPLVLLLRFRLLLVFRELVKFLHLV